MRLITCHSGKLQSLLAEQLRTLRNGDGFSSGIAEWDALAPGQSFARGAVHELAWEMFEPLKMALSLARGASEQIQHPIFLLDPCAAFYPPAIAAGGIDLDKLYLLRPRNRAQAMWAVTECLRCPGVGAAVASMDELSRLEARRLQLAAESGGNAAILLRPRQCRSFPIYAAATRWLIAPAPGERAIQRWKIQLLHGHGGRVGETIHVEHLRKTNTLRAADLLADRSSFAESRSA